MLRAPYIALLVLVLIGPQGCAEDSTPAPVIEGPTDAMDVWDSAETSAAEDVSDAVEADVVYVPPDPTRALLSGEVMAAVVEDPAALLTGPKAEGRVGDIKLYNAHAAFIVEGIRRASGYRYWGGNVVDLASVDAQGETAPDRYGEYFFAWNLQVFAPETIKIFSDGSDGMALVEIEGRLEPFHFLDSFIGDLLLDEEPPPARARYTYSLGPDDRALRLDVTFINEDNTPAVFDLPLAMASMGDGAYAFAPGRGFEVDQMVYHPPYFAALGAREGYGIMTKDRTLIPLFSYAGVSIIQEEGFIVPVGDEHTFSTWFAVSERCFLMRSPLEDESTCAS